MQKNNNYEVSALAQDKRKTHYQEVIQDINLDRILAKYGYQPLLLISLPEQKKHYLKCLDKYGHNIFIQIDKIGNIDDDIKEIISHYVEEGFPLAYSLKESLFKLVHPLINTLFFEFGHYGFSTVALNDKQEFLESSYRFLENAQDNIKLNHITNFKVYPVLKLSEIILDNDELLTHGSKSHTLLHNKLYEISSQKYDNYHKVLDNLQEEFVLFETLRDKTTEKLKEVIPLLEKWNNYYLQNLPKYDEEKENADKIKHNLINRHNLVETLLQAINTMTEKREQLNQILQDVHQLNQFFNDEFQQVEMIVE